MNKRWHVGGLIGLAWLLSGCGGDDGVSPDEGNDGRPGTSSGGTSSGGTSSGGTSSGGTSSGGTSSGGTSSGGTGPRNCHATPQPDDATRFIVAARPYADGTQKNKRFSVMSLAASGDIAQVAEFELDGFQHFGVVAFSPDGRLGAVALDSEEQAKRGGVGVFRLDDAGQPTVLHANQNGPFFSDNVAFSPDGNTLYVADANTVENDGGLFAAPIDCDGKLGEFTRVIASSGTQLPVWRPGADGALTHAAAVGALAVAGSPAGSALHLFDFSPATPSRQASGIVRSDKVLLSAGAWSPDGDFYVAAAPNDMLGGQKLFASKVDGGTLTELHSWDMAGTNLAFASPFGNAFLAVNSDPDNVYSIAFAKDGNVAGAAPGSYFGAPTLVNLTPRPQLPMGGVVIDRGALKGRVVIAEVTAIRQLQFEADGSVRDAKRDNFGEGVEHILGAFGVTP